MEDKPVLVIKEEVDDKSDDDVIPEHPKLESIKEIESARKAQDKNKEGNHLQSRLSNNVISQKDPELFLCTVCSDVASGYHYGVPACEGCKAFFKRSLQMKDVNYKCPATGNCKIDKLSRKCCQACRLEKCKGVGMSPEFLGNKIKKPKVAKVDGKKEKNVAKAKSVPSSDSDADSKDSPVSSETVEQNEMIKKLFLLHNASLLRRKPDLEVEGLLQVFCNTVSEQLINMIDWAKQLPGYCELAVSDQAVLLQAAWVDLMILTWVFHSCQVEACLALSGVFWINREQSVELGFEPVYEQLLSLISRVKLYEIDSEEMACLKAIALTNADGDLRTWYKVPEYGSN